MLAVVDEQQIIGILLLACIILTGALICEIWNNRSKDGKEKSQEKNTVEEKIDSQL